MREKWRLFWRTLHHCLFYGTAEGRLLAMLHPLDRKVRIEQLSGLFQHPMQAYIKGLHDSAIKAITNKNRLQSMVEELRKELGQVAQDDPDHERRVLELRSLEEQLDFGCRAVEDIKKQVSQAEITAKANSSEYPIVEWLDLQHLQERWRCLALAEERFPNDDRVAGLREHLTSLQSLSDRLKRMNAGNVQPSE